MGKLGWVFGGGKNETSCEKHLLPVDNFNLMSRNWKPNTLIKTWSISIQIGPTVPHRGWSIFAEKSICCRKKKKFCFLSTIDPILLCARAIKSHLPCQKAVSLLRKLSVIPWNGPHRTRNPLKDWCLIVSNHRRWNSLLCRGDNTSHKHPLKPQANLQIRI